jgi:hypothetical protein
MRGRSACTKGLPTWSRKPLGLRGHASAKKTAYPENDNLRRTPTHGYAATRDAAIAAFAKSWRRE